VDVQEELNRVLHWIAALLILLLQWLYPRVPWSHVLSRIFYNHLTLSRDLTYWVPTLFISLSHYMLWGFGLSVQIHGKPFSVWGSYNNLYYFYSSCTATSLQSHVPPECSTTLWPYYVTWLLKFPCYLYLNPIVRFEVLD